MGVGTYGDYVKRLARRVDARFAEIDAEFSFDLGLEFEVAMCSLLSEILPARFGVCRGFVVTEAGEKAGDDVIIYDRLQFPTLRPAIASAFALKEQVPIEAVYAYIECKHSINDVETFDKAVAQVGKVKSLLLKRNSKVNEDFEADGPVFWGKARDWPRVFPALKNQPFTMIVARKWESALPSDVRKLTNPPDLVVLGETHLMTQRIALDADGIKGALFFDPLHWAPLAIEPVGNVAYGVGLLLLLQALSWIELVPIDWTGSVNAAFWNVIQRGRHDGP